MTGRCQEDLLKEIGQNVAEYSLMIFVIAMAMVRLIGSNTGSVFSRLAQTAK
jgi:hypothetical protein